MRAVSALLLILPVVAVTPTSAHEPLAYHAAFAEHTVRQLPGEREAKAPAESGLLFRGQEVAGLRAGRRSACVRVHNPAVGRPSQWSLQAYLSNAAPARPNAAPARRLRKRDGDSGLG